MSLNSSINVETSGQHNNSSSQPQSTSSLSQRIKALEEAGITDTIVKKRIPPYAAAAAAVGNILQQQQLNYQSPNSTKIYQNPNNHLLYQATPSNSKSEISPGSKQVLNGSKSPNENVNYMSTTSFLDEIKSKIKSYSRISMIDGQEANDQQPPHNSTLMHRSNSIDSIENSSNTNNNNSMGSPVDSLANELANAAKNLKHIQPQVSPIKQDDIYINVRPMGGLSPTSPVYPPPFDFNSINNHSNNTDSIHHIPISIPLSSQSGHESPMLNEETGEKSRDRLRSSSSSASISSSLNGHNQQNNHHTNEHWYTNNTDNLSAKPLNSIRSDQSNNRNDYLSYSQNISNNNRTIIHIDSSSLGSPGESPRQNNYSLDHQTIGSSRRSSSAINHNHSNNNNNNVIPSNNIKNSSLNTSNISASSNDLLTAFKAPSFETLNNNNNYSSINNNNNNSRNSQLVSNLLFTIKR